MMICIVLFSVRQYKKFEQKIREQPESNRRPQDLQSYALPLSYTPVNLRVEGGVLLDSGTRTPKKK